jgi:hypothetical protein
MKEIHSYPEKHKELFGTNVPKARQLGRHFKRKVQPVIVYSSPKGFAFVVNFLRSGRRYYLPTDERVRLNRFIEVMKEPSNE